MATFWRCWCALCVVAVALDVAAQTKDEEELTQVYGNQDFVSLATGSRQSVARAPAAATVITAEDIEAIGATDLDQVLDMVPGLHVSYSPLAYNPLYFIRGIYSQYNPQVLMMVNGVPVTEANFGDRSTGWGGMPVRNIARIEVIRGPGSALYGADAFAGVINIVMKTAAHINGGEAGVRAGSFDTRDAWLLHGKQGEWESAFSLEWHSTEGQRRAVDADAQTFLDPLFGTNISLAPGSVNTRRDALDLHLDLARGDWRGRMGYQRRRNLGTGAGVAQALDPQGTMRSDRYNAELTYDNPKYSGHWGVATQLSYFETRLKTDFTAFPPGAFGNKFPEGLIGKPERAERHVRLSGSALYSGLIQHKLRLGAGIDFVDLYKVRESKNFDATLTPFLGSPPLVRDVSGDPSLVYIQPHDRTVYYGFIQDEWAFASDWELTAGMRCDRYSDFGNTWNPRLALVWQTSYNLTSKFLYGRAFRAPAFAELYNINNPVALGNSKLAPETIDTLELAWDYRPTSAVQTGLNLFRYTMRDIIRFVPDPAATTSTAQNTSSQTGYGLELTASWKIADALRLSGNYAYQQNTDKLTDQDAGHAPHHQLYLRGDWAFLPDWNFNTQLKRVAQRDRAAGDSRPQIDDYTSVDVTIRRKHLWGAWDIAASVRNVFNADAREPSPAPGFIRNDLPLPGRNYFLELNYRY